MLPLIRQEFLAHPVYSRYQVVETREKGGRMGFSAPSGFRLGNGEQGLVRSARPRDSRELYRLFAGVVAESSFMISRPDEIDPSLWRQRARLKRYAAAPRDIALVALREGRIVGMLDTASEVRRRQHHVCRFGLMVEQASRGLGVGRALVAALLDWTAGNAGIERVELHVHAANSAARRLYRSLGFEEEGVRRAAIRREDGGYEDEILMARLSGAAAMDR